MALTQPNQTDLLVQAVKEAVDKRIKELVDQEVKAAQDRITLLVPEIVAGISLRLYSHISFERGGGTDILMSVRMEKP